MPNHYARTAQRVSLLLGAALLLAMPPAPGWEAPAAAQADAASQSWLTRQFASYDGGARVAPVDAPSAIAGSLATWDWLRRPPKTPAQAAPLGVQARFITTHEGWPGLGGIRSRAEAVAADSATAEGEARAFFRTVPPRSAQGQARFAMLSSGNDALELARSAWTRTGMDALMEEQLWARFGRQFSAADNGRRADALLWAGQTTAATRMLPRLEGDALALTQARLAFRSGAADAQARAAALPARLRQHPGLTADHATWLEKRGRLTDAEALLARGDTTPGGALDTERWLERRLAMGRAAMRRGEQHAAYRILAGHAAVAPGEDASKLPLSVRVDLSDTEWLAGWIALRRLNQPEQAARHFALFLDAVTTPISRSRGLYWLGRAEEARGRKVEATAAYETAAAMADYYYGQLAAEALGRTPALLAATPATPTATDRQRFTDNRIRQALEALHQMGSRERESLFVRALADSVATPGEARLAGELAQRLDRPDIGVWTWKARRPQGDFSLFDLAYPRLPANAPVPAADWIISHAIARQESSFDRTALSPAGARGLMQLMPATAADVSRRLGVPHDVNRLFSDPSHNLTLGSYYIRMRRDNFSNAMMAIAAYNAGAGNVRKWIAMNGDPRVAGTHELIDWVEMIPFTETRNYVQRVTENAVVYSLLNPKRPDANPRPSAWLRGG